MYVSHSLSRTAVETDDRSTRCLRSTLENVRKTNVVSKDHVFCLLGTHTFEEILDRLRPVRAAVYDHTEAAPACLEGTRVELLTNITTWMQDGVSQKIYWLNGAAGTGKTAVAQSIANIAHEIGFICITFFFSRASDDRRNYANVIPTLAYQLAIEERCRHRICAAVSLDNDICTRTLQLQAKKLLLDVLNTMTSDPPLGLLVVLDALDECKEDINKVHSGDLIPVLLGALKDVSFAKLFITSRRESSIERLFTQVDIFKDTRPLVLHRDIPKDLVQKDIEQYFRVELAELKRKNSLVSTFPSEANVHTLVQRSDGLFIYARTAVEYISDPSGTPQQQLEALVKVTHARNQGQYARLDELYTHILTGALRHSGRVVNHDIRNVLVALVLVQKELSVDALAVLAGTEEYNCRQFLRQISAVLNYDYQTSEPVRFLHASFPDFLSDPTRCIELLDYGINKADGHLQITERCLELLTATLRYDICGIKNPSLMNEDVPNMGALLDQNIPLLIRYACQFWAVHWLEHIRAAGSRCCIPLGLDKFCSEYLLFWIEALSLTESIHGVQRTMHELIQLMSVSLTLRYIYPQVLPFFRAYSP
jgi:hypothetical protein